MGNWNNLQWGNQEHLGPGGGYWPVGGLVESSGLPPEMVSAGHDSDMALGKLLLKPAESFKTRMHRPRIKVGSQDTKQRPWGSEDQSCHILKFNGAEMPGLKVMGTAKFSLGSLVFNSEYIV